jgi:hypothetical protein
MAVFTKGHALIIGVGADLAVTIEDAKGIADFLKDEGRCAYPAAQVNLLISEGAKRNQVLAGFEKLAKTLISSENLRRSYTLNQRVVTRFLPPAIPLF